MFQSEKDGLSTAIAMATEKAVSDLENANLSDNDFNKRLLDLCTLNKLEEKVEQATVFDKKGG
jgi:hypothetical protein